MLFNKSNNGSAELRSLTGNYFASNDFSKIKGDIEFATDELTNVVGLSVLEKAETDYQAGTDNDLIRYVQMPIAYLATLNMYRKNDLSHEDSGRKVKISAEGEKMPWEWQLEKDDAIHTEMYYKCIDRLIDYMEMKDVSEWKDSFQRKAINDQFIKTARQFNDYYPIGNSSRLFVVLSPFIREAERIYIKPALGSDYSRLKAGVDLSLEDKELLAYIYPPIPLLAMSLAFRRMAFSIIPFGVIQRAISSSQTMNAGEAPSIAALAKVADWFEDDGKSMIDDMKRIRFGARERSYLPNNDPKSKSCRV